MEEKLNKSRGQICDKLMERRREDVRDQMMELSKGPTPTVNSILGINNGSADEGVAEAARQRRSAEREGRRRRRNQARANRGANKQKVY